MSWMCNLRIPASFMSRTHRADAEELDNGPEETSATNWPWDKSYFWCCNNSGSQLIASGVDWYAKPAIQLTSTYFMRFIGSQHRLDARWMLSARPGHECHKCLKRQEDQKDSRFHQILQSKIPYGLLFPLTLYFIAHYLFFSAELWTHDVIVDTSAPGMLIPAAPAHLALSINPPDLRAPLWWLGALPVEALVEAQTTKLVQIVVYGKCLECQCWAGPLHSSLSSHSGHSGHSCHLSSA